MTKDFEKKVWKYGSVDTKGFRYLLRETARGMAIVRLPIEKLGTTAALEPWETVKEYNENEGPAEGKEDAI